MKAGMLHTSEKWQESIKRGRQLAANQGRNKWAIADLAVSTFPIMKSGGGANRWTAKADLPRTKMELWLRETGIELAYGSLQEYRQTAAGWPPEKRVQGVSFHTHRLMKFSPDRFSLLHPGMTSLEVERITAKARSSHGKSLPDVIKSIDASAGFINSALRGLGKKRLSATEVEVLGERIAKLEANLEVLLERLDMTEPGPIRELKAA